jgi:hypothetical protein
MKLQPLFYKLLILSLLFFYNSILLSEDIFTLSKNSILKGEPLILKYDYKGKGDIQLPKNVYSENGVTAEYIGIEESVNIINMNITRKKSVKFRIVTSKDGNLTTPNIVLNVDGTSISSGNIPFTVSKDKYNPPRRNSFFDFEDDIFDNRIPGFGSKRAFIEPEEDDLIIRFETNRNKVFIGETIVGYYILYYKNMELPFFERSEGKMANFPYFTSEILSDITINTRDTARLNGKDYFVQPYHRLVYALTPIKAGNYTLGETNFYVEGSNSSYFSQKPISSKSKIVEVSNLPLPYPNGFKGEVGDYNIRLNLTSISGHKDTPIRFHVRVYGEGSGSYIFNPLENLCSDKTKCNAEISLMGEERSKTFIKLKNGTYGFYSDINFEYSLTPKSIGSLKIPDLIIPFFNPTTEKYESMILDFPEIKIEDRKPDKVIETKEETDFLTRFFLILISISIVYLIYTFRDLGKEIAPGLKKGLEFFVLSMSKKLPDKFIQSIFNSFLLNSDLVKKVDRIDRICLNKKDALLKNHLIQKGLNKQEAEFLVSIKRENRNAHFRDFYFHLDQEKQKRLLNCSNLLKQEDFNE